ncbi:unnamed protein product [Effrenium voratum]|nr:unnamed protein product [Effrenium voratum]
MVRTAGLTLLAILLLWLPKEASFWAMTAPTYLVTGATDGIGRYTAELLAKRGSGVLVHGRSERRVADTVRRLKSLSAEADVQGFVADLSLMSDVRKLAEEVKLKFPVLQGLLNNAGTFDGDYTGNRVVTKEGNEYSLAVLLGEVGLRTACRMSRGSVNPFGRDMGNQRTREFLPTSSSHDTHIARNVLAPFLLSSLLLENVKASGSGRLIITSSMSAGYQKGLKDLQLEHSYSAHNAYSLSKLCDLMIAKEMSRRYGSPPELCIHTLDPDPTSSWIDTKMLRAGWSSGGHPVTRATASFTMLTAEKYGQSTGISWGCGGGGSQSECEKLWEDLVALTGAAWP